MTSNASGSQKAKTRKRRAIFVEIKLKIKHYGRTK